jgi:hypothetical protein
MARTPAHQTIWKPGTVVWFHGINPQPQRTGIVQLDSFPGDARTFVLWEGQKISGWESRGYLMTGECDCTYCVSVQANAAAAQAAPGPTYWRDNIHVSRVN